MNNRASFLFAFFVSCFIIHDGHDKVDFQGHSSYEQKVMFRRTKEFEANFTEKLKIFLKKELGIKKVEPKSVWQMSLKEIFNEVNPWGYRQQEICNDELKCLISLYGVKKYKETVNYIQLLAAKKGYEISETKAVILLLSSLFALKAVFGYVLSFIIVLLFRIIK